MVTTSSAAALGLAPGRRAVGLVKAQAVTLVTEACRYRFTAGNQFLGEVTRIIPGAINSDVDLRLRGGHAMQAVVTNDAVVELQLKPGQVRDRARERQPGHPRRRRLTPPPASVHTTAAEASSDDAPVSVP